MKGLLLDQGLPRSSASLLRERGIQSVHVGELGMSTSSDESILDYAKRESLAVVTLDSDFHSLLAISGASDPSVIRLRVQGLKARETSDLIESVLAKSRHDMDKGGALISATQKLVRIKRLPIKKP